ncbi:amino acid dehydrogenase [Burkholderia sp. SFA1]|uniref:NAD(P)/FAD-dependent oxidoreductase n=1 Tax=Caballeronia sp. CLC5 TaxID=2906764 RepID=UPI001F393382|nr:FAD-binding oxidoreductase [Caballeronia sp. CLC5]MCE4574881.1 FAD-binding oxidoreductase [Caballeronia sp. CLC5]BBQ00268.1 amino acid dehydrogenase [Burkholderia sp. SFA1]
MNTIVIGAGVVGLSVGLNLVRRGVAVTIIDELPAGSGASYGNSGFLVADTAMPVALPGMIRKVPSWLLDPEGPLRVRPGYALKAVPFVAAWLRASAIRQVHLSNDAMRRIHNQTFDDWKRLVGAQTYADLIHATGQIYLWDGEGPFATPIEDELRARAHVESRELTRDEIRDIYPGISETIGRGLLIPGNGHTTNPGRLVQAIKQQFLDAGGTLLHERVQRVWPDAHAWSLMTTASLRHAERVVIATGAWSARLLAPLGWRVPLESERGYHVILPNPSIKLHTPILHKTGYFGANSMEMGLRLAGTVELAGLDAEPSPRRNEVLVRQARKLFPKIEHDEPVYWMGHRPSLPDSLPVIGPVPGLNGLFTCFGHGHCGLTAGPTSARLLVRQMLGEADEIDMKVYSIARFSRSHASQSTSAKPVSAASPQR